MTAPALKLAIAHWSHFNFEMNQVCLKRVLEQ